MLKNPARRAVVAALWVVSCGAAWAGGYGLQSFDAYPEDTKDLGDGTQIASNTGVCEVKGSGDRYLRITRDGTGGTHASFKLPDLDPGEQVGEFDLSFELYMASNGTPADGLSLNFGGIPAGNGGGEEGFAMVEGLVIAWDTYNNGGDAHSVEVFANGVSVANYVWDFNTVFGSWAPVVIHWDANGLDLSYNGTVLASNLATPGFVPKAGDSFAFSGRTGGADQNSFIDDLLVSTVIDSPPLTGGPIINEFLADNEDILEDEDLDSSDWLELYNGQATTANLGGYYLTDDPANLMMWQLPAVDIPAYGYLLIFASEKNRTNPAGVLHTNFALDKAGGYLALVEPDGTTIVSEFTYGAQAGDVSYGELGEARTLGYLESPTPGSRNGGLQAPGPPAEDVQFDRIGGVFSGSTTLTILPLLSPTAVVRYTTNNTVPDESSPVYGGTPFSIVATTTIRARVFDPGRLPGEIKSRTLIQLAPDIQGFSSALPIVVADSFGVDIDLASNPDAPRPFRLVYTVVIDREPGDGFARMTGATDFTGRGGMHVRGQSSSGFPKKQYAWETWNNENEDKAVSILGMPKESDWVLQAPYSDKTLMRNVLAYGCARDLQGNSGGMRTRFVELFMNSNGGQVAMSDYRGVYVVIEKIKRDSNRVDIERLNTTVTDPGLVSGGYIFKKDKPPFSQPWTTATEGVPLDTHDPEILNSEQTSYLHGFINTFESVLHGGGFADPVTGYAAYIDAGSFIDNHLLVESLKEIDGYRLSQYFHKSRHGRIRAMPVWDYNLALGNANYLEGQNPVGWYYPLIAAPNYFWYPRLFQDPEFELAYWDRFWELRRSLFSDSALMARIDAADAELDAPNALGESAVTRNFNKWNILGSYIWPNADGYGTRTTHEAEVDWMKNWLTARLAWIETQSEGIGGSALPPVWNRYGGAVSAPFALAMSDPNGWSPKVIVYTTDGGDPRDPGAQVYTGPLTITSTVEIRARVTDGSRWSPLTRGVFAVDTVPASVANLVVSEFDYHPADPVQAEIDEGFTNDDDFEYIELMNIDPVQSVDLWGAAFTDGISFVFGASVPIEARFLPPGGRVVIVSNADAFAYRHGAGGVVVAGEFGGSLDNGGERVELVDALATTIRAFTYGDDHPWPEDADGIGYSLVLIAPESTPVPDHDDWRSWRSSVVPGGSPGGSDAVQFVGDPNADMDSDGVVAYLEFAQGTSDTDGASRAFPQMGVEKINVGGVDDRYQVFEFQMNLAADEVVFAIESCPDLSSWADAEGDFVLLSTVNRGDGTATVRYRSAEPFPFPGVVRRFYRLAVSARP